MSLPIKQRGYLIRDKNGGIHDRPDSRRGMEGWCLYKTKAGAERRLDRMISGGTVIPVTLTIEEDLP